MERHIGWYLVELERYLRTELPPDRVETIIREIETHLTDSATDAMAGGMSEVDASKSAIRKLGSPWKVARGYVQIGHGLRLGGASEKLALCGAIVIAAEFIVTPLLQVADPKMGAYVWIWLWAGIVLLAIGSALARRIMIPHLIVITSAVFVLSTFSWSYFLCAVMDTRSTSENHYTYSDAELRLSLVTREHQAYKDSVQQVLTALNEAKWNHPFTKESGLLTERGFLVPGQTIPISSASSYDPSRYFMHERSWKAARRQWLDSGDLMLVAMQVGHGERALRIDRLQKALAAPKLSDWRSSLPMSGIFSSFFLTLSTILHLPIFCLGALARAITKKRVVAA